MSSLRRILALMTGLTPYLSFDGTARDALEFYRELREQVAAE